MKGLITEVMVTKNPNFKGLKYYGLQQDEGGNVKLNDYDDILNARRARIDLLLDNTKQDDVNLSKLNKALSERLVDEKGLLSEFDKEDREIAQEEFEVFKVLENLGNFADIKDEDLLGVSLLLSDLSFIERNIVLNADQSSDLVGFKGLFIEKKASGEEYSDEECKNFLDNIEKINTIIKLELEGRIEGLNHNEKNDHDDLQDEIGHAMDIANKSKKGD